MRTIKKTTVYGFRGYLMEYKEVQFIIWKADTNKRGWYVNNASEWYFCDGVLPYDYHSKTDCKIAMQNIIDKTLNDYDINENTKYNL